MKQLQRLSWKVCCEKENLYQIQRIKKLVLPDFLKFAITNSIQSDEDKESADMVVPKMQESLDDYNAMFSISLEIGEINSYN